MRRLRGGSCASVVPAVDARSLPLRGPVPGVRLEPDCRAARSGLAVKLGHVLPVHKVVEPGFQVFRPRIAVIDVVGVLPHIHA